MLRREPLDPVAHERFERVWPAVDPPLDPVRPLDVSGEQPPISRSAPSVTPLWPAVDSSLDPVVPLDSNGTQWPISRSAPSVTPMWSAADPVLPLDSSGDQWPGLISRPASPIVPASGSALSALNPGRRAVKALAVVGVAVVAVAAFIAWRSQPRAEVVTGASPSPAAAAISTFAGNPPSGNPPSDDPLGTGAAGAASGSAQPAASGSPISGLIVVAVTGRVRHPGLVDLPPGSRVADAIAAAGGVLPKTDLSFVNLARKVTDGELIVIGVQPSPGMTVDPTGGAAPTAASGAPDGTVDLNTASLEQLETLPGIGPALAQRIVDYRSQHGGFHSVDELQDVSGIGPAKFAEIKSQVTV